MSTCKKCGRPIKWIRTKDSWEPCDPQPIEYHKGETPDFEERLVTEDGKIVQCTFDFQCDPDGVGWKSHWATCQNANEFRR